MKILYAAGNRIGASYQLKEFLKNSTKHTVRVAAYVRSSQSIEYVDWLLEPVRQSYDIFRHDIERFAPDLVISDMEPHTAKLADMLSIPLWYCSPVHLLDGVKWKRHDLSYTASLTEVRDFLHRLPYSNTKLIYSPLGNLINSPNLKDGFEWVTPYYNTVGNSNNNQIIAMINDTNRFNCLNNILKLFNVKIYSEYNQEYLDLLNESSTYFTTGSTNSLSDALYNNKKICIAPNVRDPEEVMNAIACTKFGLGVDLGQVELMEKYAMSYIAKAFEIPVNPPQVNIVHKKLHERL